jgi:hypothetical protein
MYKRQLADNNVNPRSIVFDSSPRPAATWPSCDIVVSITCCNLPSGSSIGCHRCHLHPGRFLLTRPPPGSSDPLPPWMLSDLSSCFFFRGKRLLRTSLETASVVVFSSLSTPARLDHASIVAALRVLQNCVGHLHSKWTLTSRLVGYTDLRMRLVVATARFKNPQHHHKDSQ